MATLPDCALPCFMAAIANSTCSPLDAACQCASPEIGAQAGACVMTSCSVRDALATANLSQRQCGVAPATDNSLLAPVITFTAIAGVAVLLRPVSRILTKNKFWWDDMFNLLAAVVCAAFFGITIYANKLGLGTEMWAVPPDNIPIILSISFFFMLLYGLCRFLTRCSIILFYLRIFGNTDARPWLWGVFVFNITFVIVFIFVMCFQCTPLSHFWLRWDGEHPGYCINANTYTLALGIIEAVEDLVLLALPFPFIAALRLTWKKRIPVIVMFAWGLLTLIITIIRIPTINKFTLSANVTLDGVPIALWSNLELDIGLICACLPTLYPLVRQAKSGFAKLTTTLGNSKSNPSSKSGPTFVQNPDGTWPNINTTTGSNSQYNNAKISQSFRAWGLNTNSNITVTTSVAQAEERHDAGAYVALPDPPPSRDASLTTHKPGMDIEMGDFDQLKEVTRLAK